MKLQDIEERLRDLKNGVANQRWPRADIEDEIERLIYDLQRARLLWDAA